MHRSFQLITLLVLPTLAWADGLSDLRAGLQHLHGHSPVTACVTYSNWQEVKSFLKPTVTKAAVQVRVAEDASGLHLDWNPPQLKAVEQEMGQVSMDSREPAPIRAAMQELDAGYLDHLLNQANILSQTLDRAKFKQEVSATYEGKPATLLVFTFNPVIRSDHLVHVSSAEGTLKIWMGDNGRPVATESETFYSGKHTRLYGSFHVRSKVRTTYTVLGERLLLGTQTSENLVYDGGEKVETRKALSLASKG